MPTENQIGPIVDLNAERAFVTGPLLSQAELDALSTAGLDAEPEPPTETCAERDARVLAAYAVNLCRGRALAPFEFEHLAQAAARWGMELPGTDIRGEIAHWRAVAAARVADAHAAERWRALTVAARPRGLLARLWARLDGGR